MMPSGDKVPKIALSEIPYMFCLKLSHFGEARDGPMLLRHMSCYLEVENILIILIGIDTIPTSI